MELGRQIPGANTGCCCRSCMCSCLFTIHIILHPLACCQADQRSAIVGVCNHSYIQDKKFPNNKAENMTYNCDVDKNFKQVPGDLAPSAAGAPEPAAIDELKEQLSDVEVSVCVDCEATNNCQTPSEEWKREGSSLDLDVKQRSPGALTNNIDASEAQRWFPPDVLAIAKESPTYHQVLGVEAENMSKIRAAAARLESTSAASAQLQVQYSLEGDVLHVFVRVLSEAIAKSRCRKAFSRYVEWLGPGFEVETNVASNNNAGAQGQLGSLVPDMSVFVPGGNGMGDMTGGNPNHGDVVMEVEWLHLASLPIAKAARFFHPNFVGLGGSTVQEVWIILIPQVPLVAPVGGYTLPNVNVMWSLPQPPAPNDPLLVGVPFAVPAAGAAVFPNGVPAMPVVIVMERNNAFPPTIYHLQWNHRLRPPAASRLAALDIRVNNVLRETYMI